MEEDSEAKPKRIRRKHMSPDDMARFTARLQIEIRAVCQVFDPRPEEITTALSTIAGTLVLFQFTTKRKGS